MILVTLGSHLLCDVLAVDEQLGAPVSYHDS